jgi:hypothetical protein
MIAHHSFAAAHPWWTVVIVWLTIDALIVCFIATRTIQRNRLQRSSGRAELRKTRNN